MTKSVKGTTENPGKNVRQKAGLNRSMHAQGIGEVNRQQQYKSEWRGGIFIPCPPALPSMRLHNERES
jgi:putative transposase